MKRFAWSVSVAALLSLAIGVGATWGLMRQQQVRGAQHAAQPLPAEQVAAILKSASEGKVALDKVLPTTSLGYTAAIAKTLNGKPFVAWVGPDGKSLLLGALFGRDGTEHTREVMLAHHLIPDVRPDTARKVDGNLFDAVAKADAVRTGTAGQTVYVFIDLNCGFCSQLYQQLAPLVTQGRLRVNWIPVAVLHETSLTKAAELLQAPDRALRLAQHEAGHDAHAGQGGILGVPPTQATQTIVAANTELLRVVNNGQLATPMLVFRGPNGEVFQHAGVLREATDILNAGG